MELDADKDMNGVLVTITDEVTGRVLGEWQADLKRGTNRVTVDFVLHKPKLWWSNGLGEPFLYRFRTDIIAGGELLDSKPKGWHTLFEGGASADKDGHTFYIELNGIRFLPKEPITSLRITSCRASLPRIIKGRFSMPPV